MQNIVLEEKYSPQVVIMSLLFAFFADIKCMTSIMIAFNITPEGSSVMAMLYVFIIIMIIAVSAKNHSLQIINFGGTTVLLVFYCFLLYFLTSLFVGDSSVSLNYFLVFTIAAFCIPSIIVIDPKIVIMAIMTYPAIGIIRSSVIFAPDVNGVSISMGQSYAFITPVLASLVYLLLYFRQETSKIIGLAMIVVCLINFIYLSLLMALGSRGPLVCVIGLILFLVMIRPNYDIGVAFKKTTLVSFLILIMLVLVFQDVIMDSILSFSGQSFAIRKFITLSQSGDITNGRGILYRMSWEGFCLSPILGNGFSQFSKNTLEPYPHNSFLQVLYDGGLIFAILLYIPLLKRIVYLLKTVTMRKYSLIVLFFFAGFVGSMFSDDLWMQPMLWLFFGIVLTNNEIIYNE